MLFSPTNNVSGAKRAVLPLSKAAEVLDGDLVHTMAFSFTSVLARVAEEALFLAALRIYGEKGGRNPHEVCTLNCPWNLGNSSGLQEARRLIPHQGRQHKGPVGQPQIEVPGPGSAPLKWTSVRPGTICRS